MPNIQSSKKALRRDNRRKKRNLDRKQKLKTAIKNYRKLIETGKTKEAEKALPGLYKTLDKMAKVNFIKENKAKRLKSRLSKKLRS